MTPTPTSPRHASSTRTLRVRPATDRDVEVLVRHRRAMYLAIGRFEPLDLDTHDARYRRWIRARLRSGIAGGSIAWRGGSAVGSGVVWLQETQPRPGTVRSRAPYLMSIYVEPGHRGAGVGSAVTRALVAWSTARGYPRVTLHASPFGRGLYRKLGFERTWEMRLGGSSISGPRPRRPFDEPGGPNVGSRPRPGGRSGRVR